jgi:hypothetical protein
MRAGTNKKNIMSSQYDLHGSSFSEYQEVLSDARGWKPGLAPFQQGLLVDQFKKFGRDTMLLAIRICAGIDERQIAALEQICIYIRVHGSEKVQQAFTDCVRMGWKSLKSVEGILTGTMKPDRGPKGVQPILRQKPTAQPNAPRKQRSEPLPEGVFDGAGAAKWMGRNRKSGDITEYFDLAGIDQDDVQLYKLKGEY